MHSIDCYVCWICVCVNTVLADTAPHAGAKSECYDEIGTSPTHSHSLTHSLTLTHSHSLTHSDSITLSLILFVIFIVHLDLRRFPGQAFMSELGEYENAIEYLTKAIDTDPSYDTVTTRTTTTTTTTTLHHSINRHLTISSFIISWSTIGTLEPSRVILRTR